MCAEPVSEPPNLQRRATLVDLHAHPSLKVSLFRRSLAGRAGPASAAFWPFSLRTDFVRLHEGAVDVLLSAVHIPEAPLFDDIPLLKLLRFFKPRAWRELVRPPYFQATLRALDDMEAQVREYRPRSGRRPVQLAHSITELEASLAQGHDAPIAIVHSVEGAHSLQGDVAGKRPPETATKEATAEILANLEALHARGVALLTLAHFYPNYVAAPCFPFPEKMLRFGRWRRALQRHDPARGLGPAGEAVVTRMLDLGMLVDVTHCTPAARAAVYRLAEASGARASVVATHVGVQAINPSPYNLADWEIRWLADHGGVAGVIFMNDWLVPHESKLGLNHLVATLQHLVDVGGEDVAALGTDFDGFTDPPDDLLDASQLPRLTRRLTAQRASPLQRRFGDERIGKILGGIALRVLREGWKKRST